MVHFCFIKASDPRLNRYAGAIAELIDSEACKLGVVNPSAYFAHGNEFMLALDHGRRLVAVVVIKRDEGMDATFLGYSLMITRAEARRRGLLAKMTTLYLLRALPRVLGKMLLNPSHRLYVYGDIATPMVYAKVLQLRSVTFYPDLIRGDSPAAKAKGAELRAYLVERCGIRNMWQRPGLVHDVDINTGVIQDTDSPGVEPTVNSEARTADRDWAVPWSEYVPANADLLVIVPIEPLKLLAELPAVLRFAFGQRARPKANLATSSA